MDYIKKEGLGNFIAYYSKKAEIPFLNDIKLYCKSKPHEVNSCDNYCSKPPLWIAIYDKNYELALVLLNSGANVDAQIKTKNHNKWTVLCLAQHIRMKALQKILLEYDANTNIECSHNHSKYHTIKIKTAIDLLNIKN